MKIQHILLTAAAVLFCTASMTGQSSHTWVSATGKDSSACTEEKPCATFQGALVKTDAGGMISVASPGDFGPVIIAKSVTIDGSNMAALRPVLLKRYRFNFSPAEVSPSAISPSTAWEVQGRMASYSQAQGI